MVLVPRESCPLIPRENSVRAFSRSFRRDRILDAYCWKISPDLVSRTSRLARSKRRKDKDCSKERMWPLTVGCVRKRSSAALEKLFKSATRQKVSRCRNSICNAFLSTPDKILNPFTWNCKQKLDFQKLNSIVTGVGKVQRSGPKMITMKGEPSERNQIRNPTRRAGP